MKRRDNVLFSISVSISIRVNSAGNGIQQSARRAPEQSKQIFGTIHLQRILASQNLRSAKISDIRNCLSNVVLKCSSFFYWRHYIRDQRHYRPSKIQLFLCWSICKERGQDILCFHKSREEDIVVSKPVLSIFYPLLIFIMFSLRDTFSLCQGFRMTRQCGGLKYLKDAFQF